MSKILTMVAAALFAVQGAAARPALQADFGYPAQLDGDASEAGLHWVLLVFHHPSVSSFNLVAQPTVTVVNTTILQQKGGYPNLHVPVVYPDAPNTFKSPVTGTLWLGEYPWASLYLEAASIRVEVKTAHVGLTVANEASPAANYLPHNSGPPDTTREKDAPVVAAGSVVASAGHADGDQAFPLAIHASGVHRVLWHNATLDCSTTSCPDSGKPWATSADLGGTAWIQRQSYIDLSMPDGTLDGSGNVWTLAGGASQIGIDVQGSLRLPSAHLSGECTWDPCDPAGKTFSAKGRFSLSGLAPSPQDRSRLRADLDGDIRDAAFDETQATTFGTGPGALAGATLVGLGILVKVILGLFARTARPPVLQHPRRREIFEFICAEPGLSLRDLQRQLRMPMGPLQNHLKRLVEEGMLVAERYRNTVRYFENHGRHAETWKELAQLREPGSKRLHDWLLEHPGQSQAILVQTTHDWGWSRGATQRRLRNLVQANLVAQTGKGRNLRYSANPSA